MVPLDKTQPSATDRRGSVLWRSCASQGASWSQEAETVGGEARAKERRRVTDSGRTTRAGSRVQTPGCSSNRPHSNPVCKFTILSRADRVFRPTRRTPGQRGGKYGMCECANAFPDTTRARRCEVQPLLQLLLLRTTRQVRSVRATAASQENGMYRAKLRRVATLALAAVKRCISGAASGGGVGRDMAYRQLVARGGRRA